MTTAEIYRAKDVVLDLGHIFEAAGDAASEVEYEVTKDDDQQVELTATFDDGSIKVFKLRVSEGEFL